MSYARPPASVTDHATDHPGSPAWRRAARRLLHWLLPSPCLSCRETVWETRDALGLCPQCRGRLVRWPDGCAVCGRSLDAAHAPAGYRCGACRKRPPPYDRLLSAWCYQPPLDEVMTGLKFRRLDYLGTELGHALARSYRERLEGCDVVVPVPLHWTRRLRRGFNQAALIARPLARALELPIATPLGRRRPTLHQSRLGRWDRRRNLAEAFVVRRDLLPGRKGAGAVKGRRVLLVDDVVTTGATLEAAAACLKRAGARRVVALTAARTPPVADRPRFLARAEGTQLR